VLVDGRSTDDNTLGVQGTLSAVLATGEVVGVYDGATRLGPASVSVSVSVSGTSWTYTAPSLSAGAHALTARVENSATGFNGQLSTALNANVLSSVAPAISVYAPSTNSTAQTLLAELTFANSVGKYSILRR
jgi:hypothetical protein